MVPEGEKLYEDCTSWCRRGKNCMRIVHHGAGGGKIV